MWARHTGPGLRNEWPRNRLEPAVRVSPSQADRAAELPDLHACYDSFVFNLGSPKTGGDWIVHIAGAIVAIFLVWWMLRLYVL